MSTLKVNQSICQITKRRATGGVGDEGFKKDGQVMEAVDDVGMEVDMKATKEKPKKRGRVKKEAAAE